MYIGPFTRSRSLLWRTIAVSLSLNRHPRYHMTSIRWGFNILGWGRTCHTHLQWMASPILSSRLLVVVITLQYITLQCDISQHSAVWCGTSQCSATYCIIASYVASPYIICTVLPCIIRVCARHSAVQHSASLHSVTVSAQCSTAEYGCGLQYHTWQFSATHGGTVQSDQYGTDGTVQLRYISDRYTVHAMWGYSTVGSVYYRSIIQYSAVQCIMMYRCLYTYIYICALVPSRS